MNQVKLTKIADVQSDYDRRVILLAGSAVYIFGIFLGCALYRLLGIGESELYDNLIERYFVALFYSCTEPTDVLSVVAECCLHELAPFIAVYFGGYTLFSGVIGAGALLYRGLLYGFSLTMLGLSPMSGLLFDSLVYLAAGFAISMLLVILSAGAFAHYYPRRSPRFFSAESRRYFALFLRITALVFANVCGMLFMIYVYI